MSTAIAPEQTNAVVSIDQLTAEIVVLKQQTAINIIEIGRRLTQAKEQMPHGEWGTWLRNRVDFSQNSAARFMKVAEEAANSSALMNLGGVTKVYALLGLPSGEREEFAESPHLLPSGEVKTVPEMSTRELQRAIEDKKRLQSALDTAKADAKRIADMLAEERKQSVAEISGLKGQLTQERTRSSEAAIAVQELAKMEKQLKEKAAEVDRLEEEAKQPITVEPAVIEKVVEVERVPDSIAQEMDALRQKAKSAQASEAEVKFRVQFDLLVANFRSLLAALGDIGVISDVRHDQLKGAVEQLLTKMRENL